MRLGSTTEPRFRRAAERSLAATEQKHVEQHVPLGVEQKGFGAGVVGQGLDVGRVEVVQQLHVIGAGDLDQSTIGKVGHAAAFDQGRILPIERGRRI